MLFSTQLFESAAPIFQAILDHPFIRGIAQGVLPPESLFHYVQQDTLYLKVYAQVYGIALSQTQDLAQMRLFYRHLGSILEGERVAHQNFCRVAGVDLGSLEDDPAKLAPTTHHYIAHLLSAARSGQLGETVAAILPCHWIYAKWGTRLMQDVQPTSTHPFYDWIAFYAADSLQVGLKELVEELDLSRPGHDRARMRQVFLDGCHLEYRFFHMAYTLEKWSLSAS